MLSKKINLRAARSSSPSSYSIILKLIETCRKIAFLIVLSIVVSSLVFIQFKQQVSLTSDIYTNFILAFGFEFSAQKIESPALKRD
jgi:hypothetical protein